MEQLQRTHRVIKGSAARKSARSRPQLRSLPSLWARLPLLKAIKCRATRNHGLGKGQIANGGAMSFYCSDLAKLLPIATKITQF
jgi:hypothetical protein